jgi:hypothetical protein
MQRLVTRFACRPIRFYMSDAAAAAPAGPSKSELKKRAKEAEKEQKRLEREAKEAEQKAAKAAADVVRSLAYYWLYLRRCVAGLCDRILRQAAHASISRKDGCVSCAPVRPPKNLR